MVASTTDMLEPLGPATSVLPGAVFSGPTTTVFTDTIAPTLHIFPNLEDYLKYLQVRKQASKGVGI